MLNQVLNFTYDIQISRAKISIYIQIPTHTHPTFPFLHFRCSYSQSICPNPCSFAWTIMRGANVTCLVTKSQLFQSKITLSQFTSAGGWSVRAAIPSKIWLTKVTTQFAQSKRCSPDGTICGGGANGLATQNLTEWLSNVCSNCRSGRRPYHAEKKT